MDNLPLFSWGFTIFVILFGVIINGDIASTMEQSFKQTVSKCPDIISTTAVQQDIYQT